MSLTRKLHTESTESHAAQQMHTGVDPNLGQLNDRQLANELTSQRANSNDRDGLLNVDESDAVLGEAGTDANHKVYTGPDNLEAEIAESRSASWGQPSATDRQTAQLNANQHADDVDLTEGHS